MAPSVTSEATLNAFDLRLLSKVVSVALQEPSSSNVYISLLSAFLKIANAMSTCAQLLEDNRYYEWLQRLALLPLESLADGVEITPASLESLEMAKRLRLVHVWKLVLRARHTGVRSAVREVPMLFYWQIVARRVALRQQKQGSDKRAWFDKWRLWTRKSCLSCMWERRQQRKLVKSVNGSWKDVERSGVNGAVKRAVMDKFKTALGGLRREAELEQRIVELQKQSASRWLVSWRHQVRSKLLDEYINGHLLKRALGLLKRRYTKAIIQSKSAEIYDEMRLTRQAMLGWIVIDYRHRKEGEQACKRRSRQVIAGAFKHWLERRESRATSRDFMSTWRSRLGILRASTHIADKFWALKTLLRGWQTLQTQLQRARQLEASLNQLSAKKRARTRLFLTNWRRAALLNSEKYTLVDTWHRRHTRKLVFRSWGKQTRLLTQAGDYHNVVVARHSLHSWRFLEQHHGRQRDFKSHCMLAWIRRLREIRSTRFFYGRLLVRRFRSLPIPAHFMNAVNYTAVDRSLLNDLINRAVCWQHWFSKAKRISDLNRQGVDYKNYRAMKRLQKWHAMATIKLVDQRLKERVVRAFKLAGKRALEKEHRCALRLKVHPFLAIFQERLETGGYIGAFRTFKKWEQAFQVRRMEEHLCSENLKAHQAHQTTELLTVWRCRAVERLYGKIRDLDRKKGALKRWRGASLLKVTSRRHRIRRRFTAQWRQQLTAQRHAKRFCILSKRCLHRALGLFMAEAGKWRHYHEIADLHYQVRLKKRVVAAIVGRINKRSEPAVRRPEVPWFLQPRQPVHALSRSLESLRIGQERGTLERASSLPAPSPTGEVSMELEDLDTPEAGPALQAKTSVNAPLQGVPIQVPAEQKAPCQPSSIAHSQSAVVAVAPPEAVTPASAHDDIPARPISTTGVSKSSNDDCHDSVSSLPSSTKPADQATNLHQAIAADKGEKRVEPVVSYSSIFTMLNDLTGVDLSKTIRWGGARFEDDVKQVTADKSGDGSKQHPVSSIFEV